MIMRFEQVKVKGVRRWKENGKQRQETKIFMQTLNPFNKNAEGFVKNRTEIYQELMAERAAWLSLSAQPPRPKRARRKMGNQIIKQPERPERGQGRTR